MSDVNMLIHIFHIWHAYLSPSTPLPLLCSVLLGMTHCFVLLGDWVVRHFPALLAARHFQRATFITISSQQWALIPPQCIFMDNMKYPFNLYNWGMS